MKEETRQLLKELAERYETHNFIVDDPVMFPSRYHKQVDIEIVGFIASWLAYGNRKAIIKTCETLFKEMLEYAPSPYDFIMNQSYIKFSRNHPVNECLYRFYKYMDFYDLCESLRMIYKKHPTMETAMFDKLANRRKIGVYPIQSLIDLFPERVKGVPHDTKSACKRLCMFMRWMARKNSPVDLGIWRHLDPKYLLMPLDTHVARIGRQLGLITLKRNNMDTVLELTYNCRRVFPKDPCKCDFALFGYGVNNK